MQLLIESLACKPYVIVCSETWRLEYYKYFQLQGYDIFYNESFINQNDGVVIFLKKSLIAETVIEDINGLRILSTDIKLNEHNILRISGLYRCHDFDRTRFVTWLSAFLKKNKNCKNH